MKKISNFLLIGLLSISILLTSGCNEQQKEVSTVDPWDELINVEFVENYPTAESADRLMTKFFSNAPARSLSGLCQLPLYGL